VIVERVERRHQRLENSMSNRNDHARAGAVVGVLTAFTNAEAQQRTIDPLELLGGLVGGLVGARLPDIIESATSPHHRQFAHSVTFAMAASATLGRIAVRFERWCWSEAARVQHTIPLLAALLRVLGGLAVGVTGGYASHLVLDAGTPMGIPLLGNL
jgi:membrane-bound metal-dependent hydrolase YbcI (DUF457 family)